VDDDQLVLKVVERSFGGRFDLTTARSAQEALAIVREAPLFAVIVSDMRMPGMDGIELLQELKVISPDSTRIMLTSEGDQLSAMEAVNSGRVFRFLTKPWNEEALEAILEAGVQQHELVTSSRVLLEETLAGSVQMLVDLLSVFDPKAFGQAQRVKDYALKVAARLGAPGHWDLELAALLAPVGRMAIPLAIQSKVNWGEQLTVGEREIVDRVPETGARIVGNIPRLQPVARVIRYMNKDFDGGGYPEEAVAGEGIPLEARILRVVTAFLGGLEARGSRLVVLEQLKLAEGLYDPNVLDALEQVLRVPEGGGEPRRALPLRHLEPGMRLVEDLCTPGGALVLAAGTTLAQIHLERLRSVAAITRIPEPVLVDCG